MKKCETCGKELSVFNVWEANGKIQCQECCEKEHNAKLNEKNINEEKNDNELKASIEHNFYNKVNSTNGWASTMKIILIILLIILWIAGTILSFYIGEDSDSFILGFFAFIGFGLGSFVLVGMSMSLLQLAEDVSYLKNYFITRDKIKSDSNEQNQ